MPIQIVPAQSSSSAILSVCMSHTDPLIPTSQYDTVLAFKQGLATPHTYIGDFEPDLSNEYKYLFSSAAVFSLPTFLANSSSNSDFIYLTTYRKTLCDSLPETYTCNDGFHYEVSVGDNASFDPQMFVHKKWALGAAVYTRISVLHHYHHCHKYAIDYVDYARIALELGLFTSDDFVDFLGAKLIIAGCGEIGLYPTEWYIKTALAARKLGLAFLAQKRDAIRNYDSHQVRSISFLTERFFTFCLLRDHPKLDFRSPGLNHPFAVYIPKGGPSYSPGVIPASERV